MSPSKTHTTLPPDVDSHHTSTATKGTTTAIAQALIPTCMSWPKMERRRCSLDPPTLKARFLAAPPPHTEQPPAYSHHTASPAATATPTPQPLRILDGAPSAPATLATPATNITLSRLVTLPPELLLELADHLPLGAIYHLHLSCRHLHNVYLHRLTAAFRKHTQYVLAWAVQYNSPHLLTRALAAGAFFRNRYMTRTITLHHAALLPALFAAVPGYNINKLQDPALHHAARQNAEGCVVALLHAGAWTGMPDREGNTALYYALRGGFEGVARALVAGGAGRFVRFGVVREAPRVVVGRAGLVAASWGGDAVLYVVQYKPRMIGVVAEAGWVRPRVKGGVTPVQMAVREGRVEVVRVLLEAGADPDELGDGFGTTGWAPLHECVFQKEREEMVDLLVEKGARLDVLGGVCVDVNPRSIPGGGEGLTPLQLARRVGTRATVAKLQTYQTSG